MFNVKVSLLKPLVAIWTTYVNIFFNGQHGPAGLIVNFVPLKDIDRAYINPTRAKSQLMFQSARMNMASTKRYSHVFVNAKIVLMGQTGYLIRATWESQSVPKYSMTKRVHQDLYVSVKKKTLFFRIMVYVFQLINAIVAYGAMFFKMEKFQQSTLMLIPAVVKNVTVQPEKLFAHKDNVLRVYTHPGHNGLRVIENVASGTKFA